MFPVAEKLLYYNIGKDLISAQIIDEQEDNFETEHTKDTVDGQSEYQEPSRIHHINWLQIKYNSTDGFIQARYKPEAELIAEYGTDYVSTLANWSKSDPIYFYKGSHFFVYPAPATGEGAADYLKISDELLPADLTAGATPTFPADQHYLLAVFAAYWYHKNNNETELAAMRARDLPSWMVTVDPVKTMFPRARQAELIAGTPDDDGSNY